MKVAVIVVGAGSGKRFEAIKQYSLLGGREIIHWSIAAFHARPDVVKIIPVIRGEDRNTFAAVAKNFSPKLAPPVMGGAERYHSVINGLNAAIAYGPDFVLIHDAARPCVPDHVIHEVISNLEPNLGVIPVIAASDTIKLCDNGRVSNTLNRSRIYLAQTPQGFCFRTMLRLREHYNSLCTDDAYLFEQAGKTVKTVPGSQANLKITVPHDMKIAELWLREDAPV